ncbi:hypothetical protein PFISCL1PPCAC_474, partial [Pristionchus fissidentatus]
SANLDALSLHQQKYEDNAHDMLFGIPDTEWVNVLVEMYGKRIRQIYLHCYNHAAISESEAKRLFQMISTKKMEVLISSNMMEDPNFERIEDYTLKVFSELFENEKFRFEMKQNTVTRSPFYYFPSDEESKEIRKID